MPSYSTLTPVSVPAAKPSCDRLVTPNCEPYCDAPPRCSATPLIGTVSAPTELVVTGMSIDTGADRRDRRAAVDRELDRRHRLRHRRRAAVVEDRGAVGRNVDVPGVGAGLLEVVGQRDVLPLGVVDRHRGRVVVGRRVAEVDLRAGGRQRRAARASRFISTSMREVGVRVDAGRRQLHRRRPALAARRPARWPDSPSAFAAGC